MFFVRINEFLIDVKTIFSNSEEEIHSSEKNDDPNIISLGVTKQAKREATVRAIAQLLLTLFVIGLCLYVVSTKSDGIGEKLAYTGFGVVFGYWFR